MNTEPGWRDPFAVVLSTGLLTLGLSMEWVTARANVGRRPSIGIDGMTPGIGVLDTILLAIAGVSILCMLLYPRMGAVLSMMTGLITIGGVLVQLSIYLPEYWEYFRPTVGLYITVVSGLLLLAIGGRLLLLGGSGGPLAVVSFHS